ncbi:aldehyde dehydrogenase family protein [Alcanivorax quisquiliarum]|uniref:Aldehyde dehydrogenase family protein n=1 Tax=Alcanivorax quisquiliarum TaxID=2933565 RepID=A0ABT0E9D4_9GAMM|nr:aldehyde dehydrogenase family protein [Alcanivorax quisquiliarum]MCK0538448.1 aldehyde dehydrogenase family protein [Alcanivorax quisquiliarum]
MSLFVADPVSGRPLYSLETATPADCQAAMASARSAAAIVKTAPIQQRLEAVAAVLAWLGERREWLLDQIVAESGRSRGDAMLSDLFQLTEDLHWLRANARGVLADERIRTPLTLLGKRSRILHEPRGVVLVISPWNLPLAIGMTAAMFAFVAGNAVILKPSEHTPMAAAWAEVRTLHPLLAQGLQILHGDGEIGRQLISLRPDLIAFTGSLSTGQHILSQAAPLLIPVVMELGAKDAMLVFADADVPRAVAAACWGNLHNSGQSCTAVERLYVQRSLFDEFIARLVGASKAIRVGTDAEADLGGITTDFQLQRIEEQVADARQQGAVVHCGGRRSDCGRYYLPTVISGVTSDMLLAQQETFGPVVAVYAFEDEAEAVAFHNSSRFGLSTSVWTADGARAERLVRALEVGCVNVNNVMLTEGNAGLPFGGVKYSGFGRMKGAEGLRGMTQSKAVLMDPVRGRPEPNWYPYSATKLRLMARLLDALARRRPGRWWHLATIGLAIDRLVRRQQGPKASRPISGQLKK